jgi:hypothetical protein
MDKRKILYTIYNLNMNIISLAFPFELTDRESEHTQRVLYLRFYLSKDFQRRLQLSFRLMAWESWIFFFLAEWVSFWHCMASYAAATCLQFLLYFNKEPCLVWALEIVKQHTWWDGLVHSILNKHCRVLSLSFWEMSIIHMIITWMLPWGENVQVKKKQHTERG